jgi:hypothetical protein
MMAARVHDFMVHAAEEVCFVLLWNPGRPWMRKGMQWLRKSV